MSELDPELAAVVRDIEATGVPQWHALSVAGARRVEDELFTTDASVPVGSVRNLAFEGPHGEVPVRVYRPERDDEADDASDGGGAAGDGGESGRDPLPTVVFFHGGGFVMGTLDSAGDLCRRLASRADCVVVSVDYHLAPEHRFPVAVDDAFAALRWTAANARAFGGDPDRLGVAGSSAGGALAAATALRAREAADREVGGAPALRHLLLFYPMLDRDLDRESYAANADGPLLTRADVRWFWEQYLRSPVDAANPYAAPLRAPDLGGLPPSTVVTAGRDPLRDEGDAFAGRLDAADVPTDHLHYPRMCHGFLSLADRVGAADAAFDDVAARTREHLGVDGGDG
ncbi:alpha/beta hydrolase [Halobium salinum]|uniref:Alpha/beta hydrolase n=1 Tax=Halobium salinum TaxID=1364940 RepID=A0ABD5P6W5_9EURY|nr:alpha/beta hydrolase [Halobium salinum]